MPIDSVNLTFGLQLNQPVSRSIIICQVNLSMIQQLHLEHTDGQALSKESKGQEKCAG